MSGRNLWSVGLCQCNFLFPLSMWAVLQVQSTLPKSNLLDWKNNSDFRENLTYVGSKTIENKEKKTWIDLRLRRLFDLCKFDLGRVDCSPDRARTYLVWLVFMDCMATLGQDLHLELALHLADGQVSVQSVHSYTYRGRQTQVSTQNPGGKS